jgi:hypothetical protein
LHWERTFYVHRGIGPNTESFLCPAKNFKEPCPVCEHRLELMQDEDESSEKQRKELAPKQRQLILIFDRKDPDRGIQLMDQSFFAFGEVLLARVLSGEEDDHWDLFFTVEDGYTLRIVWEEETIGRGQKFIKAQSIDFKERKEPLDEDLLEEAPVLDECLVPITYKQLKQTFLQSGKDKDDDEPPRRRSRDKDEDEEPKSRKREDDDEPPKRRSRDDDEEPKSRKHDKDEDDEPPKRRRPADDDEEPPKRSKREDDDEPPKSSKKSDDDEWDERKPKNKKDADDDEPPKRRSKEDDDEEPKSRKREDDEPPKSSKKKDDWDDFDEPPKRGKREDDDEEPRGKSRSKRED